jgi:hypothetical protein
MAQIIEDDDIRPPPHYHEGNEPQVLTADTARQAPTGRRVLIVLAASLLAVGVAWILVELLVSHSH